MIKVVAGNVMLAVVDRAIQTFGAMGTTDDIPLAKIWRNGRSMRLADGPDEVHKMVIARRELRRWRDKLDPCFKHIDYMLETEGPVGGGIPSIAL